MVQRERWGPIEAFEEYYRMGEKRSLAKLTDILKNAPGGRRGPSLRTLKGWSQKHGWQEEIGERNIELRKLLAEKTVRSIAEYKVEYLKKVEMVIGTGFEKNGVPIVTCEKARDLKDLIELSLRLLGEEEKRELEIQFNINRYKEKAEKKEKGDEEI